MLDTVAVGLTVLCWRNTCLEDVHAGVERMAHLQVSGKDPDDPVVRAAEERAEHEYFEALDDSWDVLAEADPDESARIGVLLDGRAEGFGIPDDVMMRLNISTTLDVRAVLDEVLPESITQAGTDLPYNRRTVPDHVTAVVDLLQDPDRELTVGGTSVAAADILGDSWGQYTEDVIRKVSSHVKFCDLIGARRALWYAGLSGALYASAWFPNPWWGRAVDLLYHAVADGRLAEAFYAPERMADVPVPDEAFWATLRTRPAELRGPQCNWVQRSRLRDFIGDVRDGDRACLGPLDDADRFFGLAVMF